MPVIPAIVCVTLFQISCIAPLTQSKNHALCVVVLASSTSDVDARGRINPRAYIKDVAFAGNFP